METPQLMRPLAVCSLPSRGQSQQYLLGVLKVLAVLYIRPNGLELGSSLGFNEKKLSFSETEKKAGRVMGFFNQRGSVQPCCRVEGTSEYVSFPPFTFLPFTLLSSPLPCLFSTQLFI